MPMYDWYCIECNYKWEDMGKVTERFKVCEQCGANARRLFSPPRAYHIWKPTVFDQLGPEPILITSKRQLKEICEDKGVEAACLM